MRFLKLAAISVVVLFLLITAMASLLPSTVHVSRAIDIDAPFDSIYANINDVTRWKHWIAHYDSSKASVSTHTIGKGAAITINNTRVSVLNSSKEKITTSWQTGSKSLDGEFNFFVQPGSTLVTVQWHFIHHVRWYPWEKFASIVSDKVMGPMMEQSLDNLKKVVEK
jgi:hypothetical protein